MFDIAHVEFDATLDEFVDVNLRMACRTKTFRQQRWRSAAAFGMSFALVLGIMSASEAGHFTTMIAMVVIGAGVASGSFFGWLYGNYYDGYVRRYTRRMLKEMFRGAEHIHCEMELRPEGRAFPNPELRQLFIKRVRELAPPMSVATSDPR